MCVFGYRNGDEVKKKRIDNWIHPATYHQVVDAAEEVMQEMRDKVYREKTEELLEEKEVEKLRKETKNLEGDV